MFYVTRAAGEEYLEKNLKPSFKSGRITVGVWSCFYGNEIGPLVILEKGETLTAQRYLETVKKYFIPFYRRMRKKYKSMHPYSNHPPIPTSFYTKNSDF